MGRELQKKKNKSSIPRVKQKPKSKRVNPLGNAIIAANWNREQTLTQNYARLGLTSRLNSATGGTEKTISKTSTTSKLAINNALPTVVAPKLARVERDPETGKIIRVIHSKVSKPNPLNDLLLSDDEDADGDANMEGFEGFDGEGESKNPIVRQLEEQARMVPEKKVRKQSAGEKEWVKNLVVKWGSNYKGMMRDRKLNPMQQTEADIRRRVEKWRAEGGSVEASA